MNLSDYISPDEVLRHPRNWVEIPWERALLRFAFEPVMLRLLVKGHKQAERFGFHLGVADSFLQSNHDHREVKFFIRKRLDKKAFAKYMDAHGGTNLKSQHACAHYIQLGLNAGGFDTSGRPVESKAAHAWACLYGPFLRTLGAGAIDSEGYVGSGEQLGDVVVFQAVKGHSQAGHIEMWDGDGWVSDFRQNHFSPYTGLTDKDLDFTVYRFPTDWGSLCT